MSSIFLAHTSADKGFVRRLAADLAEYRIRVWLDEAEIKVGDSLINKIENAIHDMKYLGVVLSPRSLKSAWVRKEVEIALTQEVSGSKVKVLPILYKKCKIPGSLASKVYADFTATDSYEQSLGKLLDVLLAEGSDSSGFFDKWSPKSAKCGLMTGLLETKAGRIDLSTRFLDAFFEEGRRWATGEIKPSNEGELTVYAATKVIISQTPLISAEDIHLMSEMTNRVLDLMVTLSRNAGLVTLKAETGNLDQDFVDEVGEIIANFGPLAVAYGLIKPELFIYQVWVHATRSRILAYDKNLVGYSYFLGMHLLGLWKELNPESYTVLMDLPKTLQEE